MKIAANAADRFANRPDDHVAAVLVYGRDRGLARERGAQLLKSWGVDPADPFSVVELGEDEIKSDVARLADELRAMTLTGGPRAVRVRAGGDATAATMKTVLGEIDSGALDPAAHLLIEAGELQARSKLRAAFESAKRGAALACYEDNARSLSQLLDEALKDAKLTIADDARATLIPQLEGDRALARAEIDKLVTYKGAETDTPISVGDVEAISAGAEPVALDDVVDAVLGGDLEATDHALGLALAAGTTAVGITRALQRRLLQLHAAAPTYARSRDAGSAARSLRPPLFGPRLTAFKSQLALWNSSAVDAALSETLKTEVRLKSAGAADETLISRLALALAGRARRARR